MIPNPRLAACLAGFFRLGWGYMFPDFRSRLIVDSRNVRSRAETCHERQFGSRPPNGSNRPGVVISPTYLWAVMPVR